MAQITLMNGLFRWNVSSDVGRQAPNRLDDVELVRFGFACAGNNPKNNTPPAVAALLSSMSTDGPYGDDLQAVIDWWQANANRGGPQDGRVSVERPPGEMYHYDNRVYCYLMGWLNNNISAYMGDMFPRIDLHSLSGQAISATVKRLLVIPDAG